MDSVAQTGPQTQDQMTPIDIAICDAAARYMAPGRSLETQYICGWIDYMGCSYGATVYAADGSEKPTGYDWGQAIVRHQFGLDWDSHCDDEGLPNRETCRMARAWAHGEWPAWAIRPELRAQGVE